MEKKGQIVASLRKYDGQGIQDIAVGTDNIYASTDLLTDQGLKFMPGLPKTIAR